MPNFSDYYTQALSKQGAPPTTKKSSGKIKIPKSVSETKKGGDQNFMTWLGDIMSRPLYGVTNAAQSAINLGADAAKNLQEGHPLDTYGELFKQAPNLVPMSGLNPGFWSTDPKVHRTTSQMIEQTTDKLGKNFDPGYRDTVNNVNPIGKGVAGFIGDIALDPLTYIPGPALLASGKGLIKGGKIVAKAATGASAVEKKASKVVDELSKAKVPDKASVTTTIAEKLNNAEAELAAKQTPIVNDDLDAISYIAGKDRTPEQQLIVSDDKVARALKTPEAKDAHDFLRDLSAPEAKGLAKAVIDTRNAKPLEYGAATEQSPAWRDEVQNLSDTFDGKLSEMPKLPYKGKNTPIATVLADANKDDPEAILALRTHHQLTYQPAFIQAAKQGKLLDALGRVVPPKAPVAGGATETVANQLQRFQQKMVEDDINVRNHLGESLVNNLAKYTNPAHFDTVMAKLSSILDGSADIHTFKKFDSPTKRMLQQIGIDPDRVPLGVRKVQRVKNTHRPEPYVSTAPKLSEGEQSVVDKMARGSLSQTDQIAEDSLRETGLQQWVEPHAPDSRFITTTENADALRTSKSYGEGDGLLKREFNTHANYTLMKAIGKRVVGVLKTDSKLAAQARAFKHKDLYMPALRTSEAKLEELGVPITIGVGDERILLTPSQILDHLNAADRETMNWSMWNSGTAVPPTNLLDAVVAAVEGHVTLADGVTFEGPDAVRLALAQNATRYADKLGRRTGFDNHLARIRADGSSMGSGTYGAAKKGTTSNKRTGEQLVEQLATLIEREAPKLRAIAEDNSTAWRLRTGEEMHDLTDKELNRLNETFTNARSQGSLIEGVYSIPKDIAKDAADIGATQKATNLTGVAVEGTVDPTVQKTVESYVKTADKAERIEKQGGTRAEIEAEQALSAQERTDLEMAQLRREQEFEPGGAVDDLGETISQGINDTFFTKMRGMFDTSYGNRPLHESWRTAASVYHMAKTAFSDSLGKIQRQLNKADDPELARQAFYQLQQGLPSADSAVNDLAKQFEPLVGQIFGSADNAERALTDNGFLREGINLDRANEIMTRFGLGDHLFDVDKATLDAAKSGRSVSEELARQWRTHNVDDPIDYLSRMHTAFAKSTADQTLANDFFHMAYEWGAVSRKAKPGWQRVGNESGKSVFASYLPSDAYFHPEALRNLHVIDSMMRNTLQKKGPVWDFLNNYYVPALDLWKWGNTLPNPTHHFRNFTGDSALTYLANGAKGFRSASKKALQAMATHNAYDGYDAVKALQGIHELPNAGKILTEGKLGKLSAADYYQAAMDRGNLPSFQVLEQLETKLTGTAAPARAWEKLTGTKGAKVIGGVSEQRDHYVRMVHFIQYTEQRINSGKYKALEDLLDEAAESTRKWHPDGSDLTNFEQHLKLIIPFYSWTRKAIPLVAESILTRPGRVNAFNKASYNLAVSMGVNPQSLSDPFPDDQIFPSYLTDQGHGPQFKIDNKYFGIEPGIPTWDVLDSTIAGNPLKNILGQVNPLLKAPAELVTGKNLGTGSDIHDWSDYLDSNIPGIAQTSRITGVSPTGSIASLLQGKGLDPQYQVAKGNKQPLVSVINYLTGLGITPMSEQNAINYAQFEKMNQANKGVTGGGF